MHIINSDIQIDKTLEFKSNKAFEHASTKRIFEVVRKRDLVSLFQKNLRPS